MTSLIYWYLGIGCVLSTIMDLAITCAKEFEIEEYIPIDVQIDYSKNRIKSIMVVVFLWIPLLILIMCRADLTK